MEVMFFEQAMKFLFNTKDGSFVVDDELVASRAGDVEPKTVSQRKTGKEGPVADCMADSLVGTLLGVRLRVKGESQRDNMKELLGTVSPIT